MNRKKIIPLIVVIASGLAFGYFYSMIEIGRYGLREYDFGVLFGFMLCFTTWTKILFLDLLLTKPKKEVENQNGKD